MPLSFKISLYDNLFHPGALLRHLFKSFHLLTWKHYNYNYGASSLDNYTSRHFRGVARPAQGRPRHGQLVSLARGSTALLPAETGSPGCKYRVSRGTAQEAALEWDLEGTVGLTEGSEEDGGDAGGGAREVDGRDDARAGEVQEEEGWADAEVLRVDGGDSWRGRGWGRRGGKEGDWWRDADYRWENIGDRRL